MDKDIYLISFINTRTGDFSVVAYPKDKVKETIRVLERGGHKDIACTEITVRLGGDISYQLAFSFEETLENMV